MTRTRNVLLALLGCADLVGWGDDAPLLIARQGVFSSGGTVTAPVSGAYDPAKSWTDLARRGNTAHIDHANVFFQIPAGSNCAPIVYLHGYGQSRICWQTTPDGREGWADYFLRRGHAAFLVDQPRRGAAGATATMTTDALDAEGQNYKPGDQAWYTHFRIGRVLPERYEGSAFPVGIEALNQFLRQMTVNTGRYDERILGQSLSAVLADVRAKTGRKPVYVTHSQGSRVGWQTEAENIAAIVAIEPGGTPIPGSSEYAKFLAAKVPMVVYFGDYIDNGPEDIMSTGFWRKVRDQAQNFASRYNADGGDATVVDLPRLGITGNSHFMFQETNNTIIADHLEIWLVAHGL